MGQRGHRTPDWFWVSRNEKAMSHLCTIDDLITNISHSPKGLKTVILSVIIMNMHIFSGLKLTFNRERVSMTTWIFWCTSPNGNSQQQQHIYGPESSDVCPFSFLGRPHRMEYYAKCGITIPSYLGRNTSIQIPRLVKTNAYANNTPFCTTDRHLVI